MIAAVGHRSRKAQENGVSLYKVDPRNGELIWLSRNHESYVVGFESISPKNVLYLVDEVSEKNGLPGGLVAAAKMDDNQKEIVVLNEKRTLFSNPDSVCVDVSGRFVLVTHHGGMEGSETAPLVLFELEEDGSLGEICDVWEADPGRKLTSRSHLHIAAVDAKSSLIAVTDKGLKKIYMFRIDSELKKLVYVSEVTDYVGNSPRYCVFHPTKDILFENNESSTVINAWNYDRGSGSMSLLQSLELYPDAPPIKEHGLGPSDIRLSPDGRLLFIAVRTTDELISVSVSGDGGMEFMDRVSCNGSNPRALSVMPDGRYVYVCNNDTDNIVRFLVSSEGKLTYAGSNERIPYPGSMEFLN